MLKATDHLIDAPTTSPRAAMPAVADLGRYHYALEREKNRHDEAEIAARAESRRADEAAHRAFMGAAERASDAVRDLMFTRPVNDLADATALAVQGFYLADYVDGAAAERAGLGLEAAQMSDAWARLALVLAANGGAPLTELCTEQTIELLRRRAAGGVV